MAKYRTKVEVRTNGKVFKPGAILPDDISKLDLNFLKAKKFVEVVDVADAVSEAEAEDDFDDEEFGDGFDEMTPGSFKTADEIRKIRTRKTLRNTPLPSALILAKITTRNPLRNSTTK